MHLSDMRERTGVIVPIWFPNTVPEAQIERMILECLCDSGPFAKPENVVAVIDGAPTAARAVKRVREAIGGFLVHELADNQGKGGAVAAGISFLLERAGVEFIVTRDQDNDHLAADASNLVRLAAHMREQAGTDRVVVAGRRSSVHRHLGFVRGELEWLMNETVFDAVRWAMAASGRGVPDTRYFAAYEAVPDMQTGFKCYTRESASALLQTMAEAGTVAPGLDVRRHGAEVPVIVETLLAGGVVGEIGRLAWENQPLTTYDYAGRVQVKGTVLAWTFERAQVPLDVARQMLLNAMARRLLGKEQAGCQIMLELANWTLAWLAGRRGATHSPIARLDGSDYF